MVFDGFYIDKAKASEWAKTLNAMSDSEFSLVETGWRNLDPSVGPDPYAEKDLAPEYREMRSVIVDAWKAARMSAQVRKDVYRIDLIVGLALYDFLDKNGFNQVFAETDDWWRFVSLKLCPDLTYIRYPKARDEKERINKKRFYDHPRRIWLKTLWWYVHLSWQGSMVSTCSVLEKLGTDAIGQMIERPGRGYRVDVFHVIAAKYASESTWCDADSFKKVMARHSIYAASLEPVLCPNGITGYADRLFAETKEWMKK